MLAYREIDRSLAVGGAPAHHGDRLLSFICSGIKAPLPAVANDAVTITMIIMPTMTSTRTTATATIIAMGAPPGWSVRLL
jgi:hypothetical protein